MREEKKNETMAKIFGREKMVEGGGLNKIYWGRV